MEQEIKDIIIKFATKQANLEEKIIAKQHISEDKNLAKFFHLVYSIYNSKQETLFAKQIDTESALNRIKNKIKETNKASNFKISYSRFIKYSVAIAAMFIITFIVWKGFLDKNKQEFTQITAINKVIHYNLQDGSKVLLSKESNIEFNTNFNNGNLREIKLDGEAFFEVAPNKAKPFIVKMGKLTIKVLGTSFLITAYKNQDDIKVSVKTGRVECISKTGKVILHKNEAITFSKKNQIFKKECCKQTNSKEIKDITKEEILTPIVMNFKNTKIIDIANKLEEKFKVEIDIKSANVKNKRITANFENKNIDEIMELISIITDSKIENRKNKFILK